MAEKEIGDGPTHHDTFGLQTENEKHFADEALGGLDMNNNLSAKSVTLQSGPF